MTGVTHQLKHSCYFIFHALCLVSSFLVVDDDALILLGIHSHACAECSIQMTACY